jgi:hypothetical protein
VVATAPVGAATEAPEFDATAMIVEGAFEVGRELAPTAAPGPDPPAGLVPVKVDAPDALGADATAIIVEGLAPRPPMKEELPAGFAGAPKAVGKATAVTPEAAAFNFGVPLAGTAAGVGISKPPPAHGKVTRTVPAEPPTPQLEQGLATVVTGIVGITWFLQPQYS